VNCTACGFENPERIKFCGNCAAPLLSPSICASCGFENPSGFKFCGECAKPLGREEKPSKSDHAPRSYTPAHLAEKILRSKSALEGERKQVTVLFADVKGSMELAEQVDPEEWHRILDRFFEVLTDGVHRFEGTVNQYTGDGIMALFGAPIAHEDHAHRACYAALHLRDALRSYADELQRNHGLSFAVRMGVNSGEVVVGKIGDDLRMDYTAQGHTVGLAARMEQLANPGAVCVSEFTERLVKGFFELRDLGRSRLKGLRELVGAYELQGVGPMRTRLEAARAHGFTRLVGRVDEMAALEAALRRASAGNGQVVGVVGEAGVGKSRLCHEFVEGCRARGINVLEGRAEAHGRNVPFLPILRLFRTYYGIEERDDAATAREKVAERLLSIDEGFREILPLLFEFLGVPDPAQSVPRMDPEARQRRLFGVLRRLVREAGEAEPGVTLIEDLHWMDGGSLGFLEQWIEAIGGVRGLLLVNFRPEFHAEWMGRSYYQQLPLTLLSSEATRELVADLLGGDPSTERLAEAIHARTAGNPFFTEEMLQSLIESGKLEGERGSYRLVSEIAELELPATVQAVVAARIDRLAERDKQVLQAAAVIGREFAEPVLEATELRGADLTESLRALTRAEFLYERSLYPIAEYAFKHPLTQEVAYGSQLQTRRSRVHAAVARAIEEADADKLDERSALLAHHWEAAGDALEAARWHARAAEWASSSDLPETVRHWRQVRSLLSEVPESPDARALGVAACGGLLLGGWRMGLPEEDVETVFLEGRELARRSGELATECLMVAVHAAVRGGAGDLQRYVDGSLEAARLAERSGEPSTVSGVAMVLVYSHFSAGRLNQAWEFVNEALDRFAGEPLPGMESSGPSAFAWMETVGRSIGVFMGLLESGRVAQRRGIEIARRLGDLESLSWGCGFASYLAEFSGEIEGCLERCREGFEIAEQMSAPYSRAYSSGRLGVAHLARKEWEEAIECLNSALALACQHRTGVEAEAHWLSYLAEAQLGLGRLEAAHEIANQAVATAQRRGTRGFEIQAQLARARALRLRERGHATAEIKAALTHVQSLIEETGALSYRPFLHEEHAALAQVGGDEAARDWQLHKAHQLFGEMGATGHAERLAEELSP
jgi:class 3 adenylate cyclase